MRPILYEQNETTFTSNGIGVLYDTEECTVNEVRNGEFELELKYPIGGEWDSYLTQNRYILAKPNDYDELHAFRIYETNVNIDSNTIEVKAVTITDELSGNIVKAFSHPSLDPNQAWKQLERNAVDPIHYRFSSDIQTAKPIDIDMRNVLNVIAGEEGSFIDTWGGEIKRTNSTIFLYSRRGNDRVTTIRPRKNLKNLKVKTSMAGKFTRILPYAKYTPEGENQKEIIVYGDIVKSPHYDDYFVKRVVPIDLSSEFNNSEHTSSSAGAQPSSGERTNGGSNASTSGGNTSQKVITPAMINTKAANYFTSRNRDADKPSISVEVDMVMLQDSTEWDLRMIKALEQIKLCDTVDVYVKKIKENVTVKVREIEYDVLNERIIKIKATSSGAGRTSLADQQKATWQDMTNKAINNALYGENNGIINTILTSADGKNSNFYGRDEPPAGKAIKNDLWFKQVGEGETEMWRFDGEHWVLVVDANFDQKVKNKIDDAINEANKAFDLYKNEVQKRIDNVNSTINDAKKLANDALNTRANEISQDVAKKIGSVNSAIEQANSAREKLDQKITNDLAKNTADLIKKITVLDAKRIADDGSLTNMITSKTKEVKDLINGISENYSNLRIGTTNLLRGTQEMAIRPESSLGNWPIDTSDNYKLGHRTLKVRKSKVDVPGGIAYGLMGDKGTYLKPDTDYTLSLYAKSTGGTKVAYIDLSTTWSTGSRKYSEGANSQFNIVGTWKRYWVKFHTPTNMPTSQAFSFSFRPNNLSGGSISTTGWQLEESHILSDWHPSEIDLEEQTATYIRTLEQNLTTLTQTVKTVDGKVTTQGTTINQLNNQIQLKADKTSVDSLKGKVSRQSAEINLIPGKITNAVTSAKSDILGESKKYSDTKVEQTAKGINEQLTQLNTKVNKTGQDVRTYAKTEIDRSAAGIRTEISSVETRTSKSVQDAKSEAISAANTATDNKLKSYITTTFYNQKKVETDREYTRQITEAKKGLATETFATSVATQKANAVSTELSSYKTNVANTYYPKTTVDNNITAAKNAAISSANAAATNAKNAAEATARNVAATAKSEAIASANNATDTKLRNYTTTNDLNNRFNNYPTTQVMRTHVSTEIGKINTEISNVRASLINRTEVTNIATQEANKVRNLLTEVERKIPRRYGGRNLLQGTDVMRDSGSYTLNNDGFSVIQGYYLIGKQRLSDLGVTSDMDLNIQFKVRFKSNVTNARVIAELYDDGGYKSGCNRWGDNPDPLAMNISGTGWHTRIARLTKNSYTFIANQVRFRVDSNTNVQFEIKECILYVGDIPLADWVAAAEDTFRDNGGANFLRNGSFTHNMADNAKLSNEHWAIEKPAGFNFDDGSHGLNNFKKKGVVHAWGTPSNWAWYNQWINDINLEKDTKVTLSLDLALDNSMNFMRLEAFLYDNNNVHQGTLTYDIATNDPMVLGMKAGNRSWRRIGATYTIPRDCTKANVKLSFPPGKYNNVYFTRVQFEKSQVINDFKEHPLDLDVTQNSKFNEIVNTVNMYKQTIGENRNGITTNIAQMVMNSQEFSRTVSNMSDATNNLIVDTETFAEGKDNGWTAVMKGRWHSSYNAAYGRNSFTIYIPSSTKESSTQWYFVTLPVLMGSINSGETYTFSCDIWTGSGNHVQGTTEYGIELKQHTGNKAVGIKYWTNTEYQNQWKTFTRTFTADKYLDFDKTGLNPFCFWVKNCGELRVRNLMLVKGNKIGPYTPGSSASATTVYQTRNSYAITHLTSANNVVTEIDTNAYGVRIKGKNIQLDGNVTATGSAFIKQGWIENLNASKITAGTIDASRINVSNINASNITTGQLSANYIKGGTLASNNGDVKFYLDGSELNFFNNGSIRFWSGTNAIYRKTPDGVHTAFVHFNGVDRNSDGHGRSLYASIGVTSSSDGINSMSSGRFAGIRCFRASANPDAIENGRKGSHSTSVDKIEIYGDRIIMTDAFDQNRGFSFRTDNMGGYVDMNYLVEMVRSLSRCWLHFNNVRWNPGDQLFGKAIINEYNAHMKDL